MSAAVAATREQLKHMLEDQRRMVAAAEADVQELRQALHGEFN